MQITDDESREALQLTLANTWVIRYLRKRAGYHYMRAADFSADRLHDLCLSAMFLAAVAWIRQGRPGNYRSYAIKAAKWKMKEEIEETWLIQVTQYKKRFSERLELYLNLGLTSLDKVNDDKSSPGYDFRRTLVDQISLDPTESPDWYEALAALRESLGSLDVSDREFLLDCYSTPNGSSIGWTAISRKYGMTSHLAMKRHNKLLRTIKKSLVSPA